MAIKMVREPSNTPNITNTDDFVGLRYAYGNSSGYVKSKGNEVGYLINGSIFQIKSGRIVIQGVECDIDANGVNITIDSISTTRYHIVYAQVNLATNTVSILEAHDTETYPTITTGDDLTATTTGTARLQLYKFTSLNGTISTVVKLINQIKYTNEELSTLIAGLQDGTITVKNATSATKDSDDNVITATYQKKLYLHTIYMLVYHTSVTDGDCWIYLNIITNNNTQFNYSRLETYLTDTIDQQSYPANGRYYKNNQYLGVMNIAVSTISGIVCTTLSNATIPVAYNLPQSIIINDTVVQLDA